MTKELESRLATLERQLAEAQKKAPQKRHRKFKLTGALFCFLLIAGSIGWVYLHRAAKPDNPIQESLLANLTYDVYYPRSLPSQYSFKPESASLDLGILFFKISWQDKEILFIQQPRPESDLGLQTAVGLDKIDTPLGLAYVGKNNASPIAVLATDKTLINITGTSDVPADVINGIVKNLVKIH